MYQFGVPRGRALDHARLSGENGQCDREVPGLSLILSMQAKSMSVSIYPHGDPLSHQRGGAMRTGSGVRLIICSGSICIYLLHRRDQLLPMYADLS
mmetsp:Transcript_20312/g.34247  ORF Transcript_20312/g.34247 Transcript_20312/m.34247 type:complete len:96 (+) Transcript_20312:838-1125(+)